MVVSQKYIGGPQYRPQYTIVLIIRTPKKVPIFAGKSHVKALEIKVAEHVK